MLTSIRTTFQQGIARLILIALMVLLILSFALWGIQDIFRGFRSNEAISVGGTIVSTEELQRAYTLEVRQQSRRFGKVLSPAEARLLGINRQVVQRAAGNAALDEQVKKYGLDLEPIKVAEIVRSDPAFQNGGRFDPTYFNAILRESGTTEAGLLAQQRQTYLRSQLGEALGGEIVAPEVMQEAFARYSGETRSIAYATLTDEQLGDIGQPDAAALQTFYDERRAAFRTPEYRKFTYLALVPDAFAAKVVVTDDDAKATYESRKSQFTAAEKRTVQRIAFANDAEASAAAADIASGKATFDSIAAERKLQPADLDLGTVTKAQLLDSALANAAFSLAEGTTSGVVHGRLSTVILRVTKIEREAVTPFDLVKDEIKKEVASDRARNELLDLQTKIDDERSGGASLKEIAGKLGLQVVEVAAMDAQGRDPTGKTIEMPLQDKLAPAVFANDPGSDTDPIDGRDAGTVWYAVDAVTRSRDRTLDEARADVVAAWTVDEKARRLKARADDLVKQLDGGKSLDDVAKAANLDVKQAWNLKRNTEGQGLSAAAANLVFSTPVKSFATTLSGSGTDRIVLQVTDNAVPPFDPKADQAVTMARQIEQLIGEDILVEYVTRLQNDLGLVVNQTNVNRATGVVGGEG